MKNYNDFNVTEKGKKIAIEENISKFCNTIMLQVEFEDYREQANVLSEKIYSSIENVLNTSIIIVAHSYGAFYAIQLSQNYPKIFNKILLIDPTAKTQSYYDLLVSKIGNMNDGILNEIELCKVNNFENLPDGKLNSKTIVRIHLNLDSKKLIEYPKQFNEKCEYFNAITNKNVNSKIVLHFNVSHMIHYTKSDIIIDSIKELVKL